MFTKLDQAREGDEFTITTLGETLTYQVQTIRTITPDDFTWINKHDASADQATLMTCTPYGINTHRLLITGTRVPNHDECPPETGCLTDGTLSTTHSRSQPSGRPSPHSHGIATMKCMIDEVLFLRHGRTAYNLARRLQGQIDIPLDIVGRWQADQSAYELAKTYYWAKVAHIADHNDELAQPAYEGAYLADLNEINEAPAASRRMVVVSSDLFRAQQTAHAIADLLGLDVALDPRLRERSFGEWEGMTREEILEQYADDYHSWRAHTGGETKHGVESRRHTGQRGSQAIRSIIAEHADDPTATTLLAVGHGSWIVATVAVLLDMDPDDLNNLGAMRNAFWTSMSVNTGGSNGPADPDTWQWKLDAFNQGPAIAALTDWENGPKELRGPNMPLWKPIVQ